MLSHRATSPMDYFLFSFFYYLKKYKNMAKEREFYCLTFRDYTEFCDNLTCPGHKLPLQINVEKETGTKFYTMNRLQLNEFWQ